MTSPMQFSDEVYGTIDVDEPLLLDLVNSRGLQRLRGVSQAGASRFVHPGRTVTRLEHSLGVMHLAGLLGAEPVEMAAALLQDVSHTAFSHTVDYLVEDRGEAFHERVFTQVVARTDIPAVLHKHNLSLDDVTAPELLHRRIDQPAPDLCADRIDYTLRDLRRFGRLSAIETRSAVSHLVYVNGIVAFDSPEVAADFVAWYHYLVTELFMNPLELYAHDEFARILRRAITDGVISMDDVITGEDEDILQRLRASALHGRLDRLCAVTDVVVDPSDGRGRTVSGKARIIDPAVIDSNTGRATRTSALRPDTQHLWADTAAIAAHGMVVRPKEPR
jgi:HD superfamily phosphohydrolase